MRTYSWARSSFRCIRSLIAHAIMAMTDWSVAGSIRRDFACTNLRFQAPYLLEFMRESRRYISGH
jgi:hypothetical protein